MLASYALELHALKVELQSTLARLGIEPSTSESDSELPSHVIDIDSVAETATTTETQGTPQRHPRRNHHSDRRNGPVTAWNRRQLMQELASASARRRELEHQLEEEIQRDQEQQQVHQEAEAAGEDHERRQRRRNRWQAAIVELQQQRAEILRQIEVETAADAATELQSRGQEEAAEVLAEPTTLLRKSVADPPSIPVPANNESTSETQYSIGGVVTLEPLSSQQQAPAMGNSRSGVSFYHTVAAPPPPSALDGGFSRLHYRSTPDALNDVFSLQVKFAETMLKLEKSVQMRDQLLHHSGMSSLSRRNASTRTEGGNNRIRRHKSRHRGRSFESGTNSDTSVMYRESHSSASFSSSAYSFSSIDSIPQRNRRVQAQYQNLQGSRATTAETAAPSSSGADISPDFRTSNAAVLVSFTPSSRLESPNSLGEPAEDQPPRNEEHSSSSENIGEQPERTPTSGSSTTTPTTGSDQKSNTSSSKQVHFGDDAYSTPVIARKFNFDNPSIDEDDDEHEERGEEADSVLSFLDGGSSIASSELNGASFLEAFKRFRHELKKTEHNPATSLLVELPLARELFPAQNEVIKSSEAVIIPEEVPFFFAAESNARTTDPTPANEDGGQTSKFPELAGLGIAELQERRRQLCLDIQAESAQLVLNFGAIQSTKSHKSELTKNRLLALRDELKIVDARLSELQ